MAEKGDPCLAEIGRELDTATRAASQDCIKRNHKLAKRKNAERAQLYTSQLRSMVVREKFGSPSIVLF